MTANDLKRTFNVTYRSLDSVTHATVRQLKQTWLLQTVLLSILGTRTRHRNDKTKPVDLFNRFNSVFRTRQIDELSDFKSRWNLQPTYPFILFCSVILYTAVHKNCTILIGTISLQNYYLLDALCTWNSWAAAMRSETPDFITPDLWPPNSPDLNHVDYRIWGVRVYRKSVKTERWWTEFASDWSVVWHPAKCRWSGDWPNGEFALMHVSKQNESTLNTC